MKYSKTLFVIVFFALFNQCVIGSDFVLPEDIMQPIPSEKKLRNKIFSTVQNNQLNTPSNATVPTSLQVASPIPDATMNVPQSTVSTSPGSVDIPALIADVKEIESKIDTMPPAAVSKKDPSMVTTIDESKAKIERVTHYTDSSAGAPAKSNVEQDKQLVMLERLEEKGSHDKKEKQDPVVIAKDQGVLYQQPGFVDDHDTVVFNFEDTDLANVASYIEQIHNIKFITEELLSTNKDAKGLKGHKITFRTNKILSKKESWDLFITFLNMAGLDIVPMAQAGFYKVVPFAKANNEAIPTYIGLNSEVLPDNDMVIRYVYFTKNVDPANVQKVIGKMQGGSAKLDVYGELKALIFTDKARSIKSLMQIVRELDQAVTPETLSVVKLKKANVDDVIKLYKSLKSSSTSSSSQPQRIWDKKASLEYFPQDVVTLGDNRTNSLILLGSAKGVKRIEEFIEKYIDIDVDDNAPPVFTYQLQYTTAANIQPILTQMVQYGPNTGTGSTGAPQGGVRNGIHYFQNMTIVAEPHSNKLLINSTKSDFEALKPLIEQLDIPQKQVGLEVLIVQVSDIDTKQLGSQISAPGGTNYYDSSQSPATLSSACQTFANNISAQTSGIMNSSTGEATTNVVGQVTSGSSIENTIKVGLSKLLDPTSSIVNQAGSILLTFGQPIWAVFKILKTITSTHIVANPFVVVANNSPASVSIGESRRIITSESPTSSSSTPQIRGYTNSEAALGFSITPQINKGNMVNMSIKVENNQFTGAGENNAVQSKKIVETYASVANGEVLVLGGIMTEKQQTASKGVPFLEHIPIFGWFFKSKTKQVTKDHFLIFISPRLLDPIHDQVGMDEYTRYKTAEAEKNIELIDNFDWFSSRKDPIQRAFFGSEPVANLQDLSHKAVRKQEKKKRKKNNKSAKKEKKQQQESVSFERDFLNLEPDTISHGVKNSIFKTVKSGKKYV